MKHRLSLIVLSLALLFAVAVSAAGAGTASAARERGMLYHNGSIVRTFVVPAPLPHGGTDPLYMIVDGVDGQLSVAGLGPGDPGYSGGDWAVYLVTWNTTPYLLTSGAAVEQAADAGDVTLTRRPDMDVRCPVQP